MNLSDILDKNSVLVPLQATQKSQAITQLIDLLDKQGKLNDPKAALQAVLDRENIRSTGIGQGFAIPHGKSAAVDKLVMAVGLLYHPIDFQSIDSQPVNVVVLLISPIDQTGPHIQALAGISRMMTDQIIREKINKTKSSDQLYQLIINNQK